MAKNGNYSVIIEKLSDYFPNKKGRTMDKDKFKENVLLINN